MEEENYMANTDASEIFLLTHVWGYITVE